MDPRICSPDKPVKARPCLPFSKRSLTFHKLFKVKEAAFIDLRKKVSHAFIFTFTFKTTRNGKWSLKIKMDNPTFVDEESTPLVQDENYDNYGTPNTSKIDVASFTVPDPSEVTSTLQLNQEVKRDKLAALYRHLNVIGNIGLIDLNLNKLTRNPKKGATIFEFCNGDRWVPLTKQTGEFYAPKTIIDAFGGINAMKNFLFVDTTAPSLERSISAASKLKKELRTDLEMESIPLKELSSLVEDIHVKTRENTDLDMREFLGIDKALQSIKGELLNNTSKLTEINRRIKRDTKKLQEVENDPTYSDEQRQLYGDRLDELNTEKQARLETVT